MIQLDAMNILTSDVLVRQFGDLIIVCAFPMKPMACLHTIRDVVHIGIKLRFIKKAAAITDISTTRGRSLFKLYPQLLYSLYNFEPMQPYLYPKVAYQIFILDVVKDQSINGKLLYLLI